MASYFKTIGLYGVAFYLMWIALHFLSSHLYVWWCLPASVYGIFMTPFAASASHCNGIRWVINTSAEKMTAMWVGIGACVTAWTIQQDHEIKNLTM